MRWLGVHFYVCICLRFQRQVFKHVKILLERSKGMREQKKMKGRVHVKESAYNSRKFWLVMLIALSLIARNISRVN